MSLVGTQFTVVAVAVEVWRITGSSVYVGLVGLAHFVPLLVGALVTGAVVDAVDRRRVLQVTALLLAGCAGVLAVDAVGGSSLVALYGITMAASAVSTFGWPAQTAVVPMLVPLTLRASANALVQLQQHTALVVGPALAGVVVARFGVGLAFAIDAVSFLAVVVSSSLLGALRPDRRVRVNLRSLTEGLRFVRGAPLVVATMVIHLNGMVFGMPRAVFPELAERLYGDGAQTAGLLFAAPGIGALIAALLSGWVGRVRRQGRAVIFGVALWGAAIAVAGMTPFLTVALVALACAGAAGVVQSVFRSTITQAEVPDHLRGRVAGLSMVVSNGAPRLGDAEAGGAAGLAGAQGSVISGGLLCVVGTALVTHRWPQLRAYTTTTAEPTVRRTPPR